ncbi:MAG: CDP-alcohol phosphatidyltransferase family protein [Pseudomonadota bacterium]
MFDAKIRPLIDPPLNRLGRAAAARGVRADHLTWGGFALGMAGAAAAALGWFWAALALVLLSRLADGLDGAVARATRPTDYGGFLDITLDFIFYAAVPLAFALHDPAANALAAATLLFTYFANGASFLAYAVIAAKRGEETRAQGRKSIYYLAGLAEGFETILFCALVCLVPAWFAPLAYGYAALVALSAAGRIWSAGALRGPAEADAPALRDPDEDQASSITS